jgi:hypothetical protein
MFPDAENSEAEDRQRFAAHIPLLLREARDHAWLQC